MKFLILALMLVAGGLAKADQSFEPGPIIITPEIMDSPCAKDVLKELRNLDPTVTVATKAAKFKAHRASYFEAFAFGSEQTINAMTDQRVSDDGPGYSRFYIGNYEYSSKTGVCKISNFAERKY